MSVRSYPAPKYLSEAATRVHGRGSLEEQAIRCVQRGRVPGYHLPVLASGTWELGNRWAETILGKDEVARSTRAGALLAAAGYDPQQYVYYGVLDSAYPDHELIMSVARDELGGGVLEKWNGVDWGTAEVGPDGLEFVVLDRDVMADVLDSIDVGSAGVMLRPFNPKAWVRDCPVMDYPVMAAAPPPQQTGAMVAFYPPPEVQKDLAIDGGEDPDQIHLTLVYLGDTTERPIDYGAVQRAVSKWARRMGNISGEVSGVGTFTAGEDPVTYASVDCPELPEARQMLMRHLSSEGVRVPNEHGYTPHMTLAYDDVPADAANHPLDFGEVHVVFGDDHQVYPLGQPVVAAAGAGSATIYAVVDEFDTNAVIDLVQVVAGPIAYRRQSGKWVKDQPMLMRLMGVDPPPVAEVKPEQIDSVLQQVDAYDKENPPKPDPKNPSSLAAAAVWTEDLHPRAGGKFAKKEGAGAQPQQQPGRPGGSAFVRPGQAPPSGANVTHPGRQPGSKDPTFQSSPATDIGGQLQGRNPKPDKPTQDLTDADVGLGHKRPQPGGRPPGTTSSDLNWAQENASPIAKEPWQLLGPGGELHAGLGEDFWKKTPAGFRQWAEKFLKDERWRKQGSLQGEDGAAFQTPGQAAPWQSRVPPEYKHAMNDFIKAATDHQDKLEAEHATRNRGLAAADRHFDSSFAREGLSEARRREFAQNQLLDQTRRLTRSGLNPQSIAAVMRKKASDEAQRRADFERQRRVKAEAERVRRLEAAAANADDADREAMTAAATRMPPQLVEYWTHGEGALRVRWGTDGDFERARDSLIKEGVPVHEASGAAATLHFLATGRYPGPGRGHGLTAASFMPGKLKEYWVGGKGAAQIRWGTSGDYDRCLRSLTKYLPVHMVHGACANLHKLATGQWPGKGRKH